MIDRPHVTRVLTDLEGRLLARLKGHAPEEAHGDEGDRARVSFERETSAVDTDRLRSRLVDVRAALERIRVGDYGDCTRCGESIGKKRLEAIPETAYCLSCAEALERQARAAGRPTAPAEDDD